MRMLILISALAFSCSVNNLPPKPDSKHDLRPMTIVAYSNFEQMNPNVFSWMLNVDQNRLATLEIYSLKKQVIRFTIEQSRWEELRYFIEEIDFFDLPCQFGEEGVYDCWEDALQITIGEKQKTIRLHCLSAYYVRNYPKTDEIRRVLEMFTHVRKLFSRPEAADLSEEYTELIRELGQKKTGLN